MSNRLRNNLIAGFIVIAFWIISFAAIAADPIVTDSTSTITSNGNQVTTVKSPPPSAISPSIGGSNSDLCTISYSGAVQTQILGLSFGGFHTEANCLLLKKSKTLYDMGMKVAALSVLCTDKIIFESMANAGSYCPYKSLIGLEAKAAWEVHTEDIPTGKEENEITAQDKRDKALSIMGSIAAAFLFF